MVTNLTYLVPPFGGSLSGFTQLEAQSWTCVDWRHAGLDMILTALMPIAFTGRASILSPSNMMLSLTSPITFSTLKNTPCHCKHKLQHNTQDLFPAPPMQPAAQQQAAPPPLPPVQQAPPPAQAPATPAQTAPPFSLSPLGPLSHTTSGGSSPAMPGGMQPEPPEQLQPPPQATARPRGAPPQPQPGPSQIPCKSMRKLQPTAKDCAIQHGEATTGAVSYPFDAPCKRL